MSIQFHCISCGKAIEVDNTWAHRPVTCPYCETAVTAPGASTMAWSELARQAQAPVPDTVAAVPHRRNRLALIAFVAAWASLLVMIAVQVYLGRIFLERFGAEASPAEIQRQLTDAADRQEPWAQALLVKTLVGALGSFAVWVVALLLAVVAVARPGRRGLAWGALVVCLLPAVLGVLGALAA